MAPTEKTAADVANAQTDAVAKANEAAKDDTGPVESKEVEDARKAAAKAGTDVVAAVSFDKNGKPDQSADFKRLDDLDAPGVDAPVESAEVNGPDGIVRGPAPAAPTK